MGLKLGLKFFFDFFDFFVFKQSEKKVVLFGLGPWLGSSAKLFFLKCPTSSKKEEAQLFYPAPQAQLFSSTLQPSSFLQPRKPSPSPHASSRSERAAPPPCVFDATGLGFLLYYLSSPRLQYGFPQYYFHARRVTIRNCI